MNQVCKFFPSGRSDRVKENSDQVEQTITAQVAEARSGLIVDAKCQELPQHLALNSQPRLCLLSVSGLQRIPPDTHLDLAESM